MAIGTNMSYVRVVFLFFFILNVFSWALRGLPTIWWQLQFTGGLWLTTCQWTFYIVLKIFWLCHFFTDRLHPGALFPCLQYPKSTSVCRIAEVTNILTHIKSMWSMHWLSLSVTPWRNSTQFLFLFCLQYFHCKGIPINILLAVTFFLLRQLWTSPPCRRSSWWLSQTDSGLDLGWSLIKWLN